ncbi:hypothetical protein [Bdellovibrio bacteriovorus]|uniref:hypothetical protein n=1 Tax=Bdellovibrio bacteriovorus TaxID=959 RepID=UPI0035A95207
MFAKFLNPFSAGQDFKLSQNRLGSYISLSIWCVSFVFCFYYFVMGIEAEKLGFIAVIALVGAVGSRLFHINKNKEAVILQCILMYISLIFVLTLPVVGQYVIMCVLIIVLTPIILLNEMQSGIVFTNLVAGALLLSVQELRGHSSEPVLEQILDFFIKFMVIIFVFVQVYGLRLLLERKPH